MEPCSTPNQFACSLASYPWQCWAVTLLNHPQHLLHHLRPTLLRRLVPHRLLAFDNLHAHAQPHAQKPSAKMVQKNCADTGQHAKKATWTDALRWRQPTQVAYKKRHETTNKPENSMSKPVKRNMDLRARACRSFTAMVGVSHAISSARDNYWSRPATTNTGWDVSDWPTCNGTG